MKSLSGELTALIGIEDSRGANEGAPAIFSVRNSRRMPGRYNRTPNRVFTLPMPGGRTGTD